MRGGEAARGLLSVGHGCAERTAVQCCLHSAHSLACWRLTHIKGCVCVLVWGTNRRQIILIILRQIGKDRGRVEWLRSTGTFSWLCSEKVMSNQLTPEILWGWSSWFGPGVQILPLLLLDF